MGWEWLYTVEFTSSRTGRRHKYNGRTPRKEARRREHERGEGSEWTADAAQWGDGSKPGDAKWVWSDEPLPEAEAPREELRATCVAVGPLGRAAREGPRDWRGACFSSGNAPEAWPGGLLAAFVGLQAFWPPERAAQDELFRAAAAEFPVVRQQLAGERLRAGPKLRGSAERKELEDAQTWAAAQAAEREQRREQAEEAEEKRREGTARAHAWAQAKLADPAYVKEVEEGRARARAVAEEEAAKAAAKAQARKAKSAEDAAKARKAAAAVEEQNAREKEKAKKEARQKWEQENRPKRDRTDRPPRPGQKKKEPTEEQRQAYSTKDKDTRKKRKLAEEDARKEKAKVEKARQLRKKAEEAARKAAEGGAEEKAAEAAEGGAEEEAAQAAGRV